MNKKFKMNIKNKNDLICAIEEYGFIPFFKNSVYGFSIEENVSPALWWQGNNEWKVWEWKGEIIKDCKCAYGKFFNKRAVFISKKWFCDFANFRRQGYDFDARYDDGLLSYKENDLFNIIEKNAPITSAEIKRIGEYSKDGKSGFDTLVTKLQEKCYVIINNFVYKKDKYGMNYGWGVAEYTTPEKFYGKSFKTKVYKRSSEESYERIFNHLRKILPDTSEKTIERLLK